MLSDDVLIFDGIDLSRVFGAVIYDHNFNALPSRDISQFKLARKNKSIITSAEYKDKPISVSVLIKNCERHAAEAIASTFKSRIQLPNKYLQVAQSAQTTQYLVTLSSMSESWVANNYMLTFGFIASDPIGMAVTSTEFVNTTITAQTQTITVTNVGSFDAEPSFTLVISSITGGTNGTITLSNAVTNTSFTINRTFNANDVITINSSILDTRVNGVLIDYKGIYPTFSPGIGSLTYVDSFSSRNVTLTGRYSARFV